jgi:hypothetical protein
VRGHIVAAAVPRATGHTIACVADRYGPRLQRRLDHLTALVGCNCGPTLIRTHVCFSPLSLAQFGFLVDTYRVKHTVAWELLLLARRCAFVAARCVRLRTDGASLMKADPQHCHRTAIRPSHHVRAARSAQPAVGVVCYPDARVGSSAVFGLICLFSLLAQCKTRPL